MSELIFVILILGAALALFMAVENRTRSIDRGYYRRKWQAIEADHGNVHCVTEADKLLDQALKQLRYRGETMGERLRAAAPRFKDNDQVWSAHKLRNRLVHEPDANPKPAEIKRALSAFRRALKDLGAL
jgi:hypothetical protein